jgi:hypothetical protein
MVDAAERDGYIKGLTHHLPARLLQLQLGLPLLVLRPVVDAGPLQRLLHATARSGGAVLPVGRHINLGFYGCGTDAGS